MSKIDFTQPFTNQVWKSFPTMEELARKAEKAPEAAVGSSWAPTPTKALLAKYQLAGALADAGLQDLADGILAPGSEEMVSRMAVMLKKIGGG